MFFHFWFHNVSANPYQSDNYTSLLVCYYKIWSTFKKWKLQKWLFSWLEFCNWTKVKVKHVFLTKIMLLNKIQVFFISLCFFALTFFKLDNISFLFKFNMTSHYLSDDQIPLALFTNFKKKRKVNTWNIGSSHPEVFYKIGFMTL